MKQILTAIVLFFFLYSCKDEPVETVFFDLNTENGVFIACEGNFMYGNSSLSFYNPVKQKVTNQLFYARNNAPLGDVAQSLTLHKNTLFVVANNSGKIYAVDAETIEFKGAVTGLNSPRYVHFLSDEKAYVSDLHAHHISIVNPETFAITGKIEIGEHTSEQMVQIGKYVFISSWSFDEYVLVIDSETDELVAEIKVPFQPKNMVKDKNDKIWVISQGTTEGFSDTEEKPALCRIDPITFTVERIFRFEEGFVPSGLGMNSSGDTLFYISGGIYKMSVESKQLPDSVFISAKNKLFYSIGIDSQNNEIYVSDAIDYTQDAIIYRYSSQGFLIDSFKAGINPSDFLFNYN